VRQEFDGTSPDSHLTLTFEPLTSYVIDGCIWFETTIDDAGFLFDLECGISTYNTNLSVIVRDFTTEETRIWESFSDVSWQRSILDYGESGTIIGCIYIQGTFTAITAGTLSFSWGQVDSKVDDTTVFAGSYLSAMEIN
ncbi:hypothetical protein ACFLW6_02400, partial [Chloroflexota bacterium]